MRVRGAVFVLLCIFFVRPAVAWEQMQGDAGRTGGLAWQGAPLDSAGEIRLHNVSHGTARLPGQSYLETPHGITTLLRTEDGCRLGHFGDIAAGDAEWRNLTGCPGASLQAYHPEEDLLVVCTIGDAATAMVQLRAARDGAVRFQVPLASGTSAERENMADAADVVWFCNGAALDWRSDEPLLVVPAAAARNLNDIVDHNVIGIDPTSGNVRWRSVVDARTLLGLPAPSIAGPERVEGGFMPLAATLTDDGVVVSGRFIGPDSDATFDDDPLVAWFERNGTPSGMYRGDGPDNHRSYFAAASGVAAVARVGQKAILIEPNQDAPARIMDLPTHESSGPGFTHGTPGPVWHQGTIYLPTRTGIIALDDQDLSLLWTWTGVGRDWPLGNVAATSGGELVGVAFHYDDERNELDEWHDEALLLRLDAFTGGVLQAVPLTVQDRLYQEPAFCRGEGLLGGCPATAQGVEVVVAGDKILVVTSGGSATLLAPSGAAAAPHAEYPRIGERLEVTVPVDASVMGVTLAWGDASIDMRRPESATGLFRQEERSDSLVFSHAFRDTGLARGSVTTLYDDGTTKMQPLQFDVGGTPPPDLNFIQQQFSPQNQDRTWGIIGVAMVLLGAGYGYWFRTRRHRRIRMELEALNRIHARSLEDPQGALKELDAHRRYLNGLLMSGRLDDGQYQLVMGRAAGISQRLHRRLLGDLAENLSPAFYKLMESTFSDAYMNRDEAAHLRDRLAAEKGLTKRDRARVAAMIDAWATR